jgi:autotransporter-associated beta strand protein
MINLKDLKYWGVTFVLYFGVGGGLPAASLYYDTIPTTDVIDGGTGTWDVGTLWKTTAGGTAGQAWADGNTADFEPIASGGPTSTVTISGTVSPASILFYGDGYTITGGTINNTSDIALGPQGPFAKDSSVTPIDATIESILAGTDLNMSIKGYGTLTLSGASTYSGVTHISLAATNWGKYAYGTIVKVGNALAFGTSEVIVETRGSGSSRIAGMLDLNGFTIANKVTVNSPGGKNMENSGLYNSNIGTTGEITGEVVINTGAYIGADDDSTAGDVLLSGLVSGTCGANTYAFVKEGDPMLTLSGTSNTFQGYVYVDDGVLEVTKLANLNEASSLGTVTDATNNKVRFQDLNARPFESVLRYIGSTASTTDKLMELVTDGRIEANGTTSAATLTLTTDTSTASGTAGTLTLAGTNTGNNTFSGAITGGGSSTGGLIKDGSGKWILTGSNYYTGPTTIKAGTLTLSGTGSILSSVSIEVQSGAFLDVSGVTGGFILNYNQILKGSGTISGNVTDSYGSQISPGSSAGTLTFTDDLTFNGSGILNFELSPSTSSGNDIIVVGDTVYLNGNTNINPIPSPLFANGDYCLIDYGTDAVYSGDINDLFTMINPYRQTMTVWDDTDNTQIMLNVVGNPASLIWQGDGSLNQWDLDSSNWLNGGSSDKFYNGDDVTFDNSTTNTTVELTGTLLPASVTVNNDASHNYIFQNIYSSDAKISGTTGLSKQGDGKLTLATNNDYSGATDITGGTLQVGDGGYVGTLGSGKVTIDASCSLSFNRADEIVVPNAISGAGGLEQNNFGTVILTADNDDLSGPVTVSTGTLQLGDGGTTGTLGSGSVTVGSGATLTFKRSNDVTFGNQVTGDGQLTMPSLGVSTHLTYPTLTLSGDNSYAGGTILDAGVIKIGNENALGTGPITINVQGSGSSRICGGLDLNGYSVSNAMTLAGPGPGSGSNGTGILSNTAVGTTSEVSGDILLDGYGEYFGTDTSLLTTEGNLKLSGLLSGGSTVVDHYTFVKQGNMTMTITRTDNTFDGYVYISTGVLEVTKLANLNEASSLGLVLDASNNKIRFDITRPNGTARVLRYIGTDASTTDKVLSLNLDGTVEANGTSGAATLTFTAATTGSGTLTLAGTNTGENTFAGDITGGTDNSGGLTKEGSGTWILTAENTYTGPTTISNGTLQLGAGGTTGSVTGDLSIAAASANLAINRSDDLNLANAVSGTTGSVTKLGGNKVTLTGVSTFSGTVNVDAGTLALNGGTLGDTVTIDTDTGSTFLVEDTAEHTVGAITGSGTTQLIANARLTAAKVTQGTFTIGTSAKLTIAPVSAGGGLAAPAVPVPEPGAWTLLLIGVMVCLGLRNFHFHR